MLKGANYNMIDENAEQATEEAVAPAADESLPATDTAEDAEVATEDTTAQAAEGAEPAEAVAEPDEKPRSSRHRRTKRQIEAMRREIEQLRAQAAATPEPEVELPPTADDYADPIEAAAAIAAYEARMAARAEIENQTRMAEQARQEAEFARRAAEFERKADEFAAKHPDYEDVVENSDAPMTDVMRDAILEAENGPDIAYELGSRPDLAEKIAAMPPMKAALEMGKLAARLALPQARKVSKAPAPLKPVDGSPAIDKDLSEMSQSEYEARRMKELGW